MSADTVALVGALVYEHPALKPVLAEHLQDHAGQVIPPLFLGRLGAWLDTHEESAPATRRQVVDWLRTAYLRGGGDVRDALAIAAGHSLQVVGTGQRPAA